MSKLILLDSGPLGIVSNPGGSQTVITCREWARRQHASGHVIVVPEIADYELRRELLRADKFSGLRRVATTEITHSKLVSCNFKKVYSTRR